MTKSGRWPRLGADVKRAIIGLFVQTPMLMSEDRFCQDHDRLNGCSKGFSLRMSSSCRMRGFSRKL